MFRLKLYDCNSLCAILSAICWVDWRHGMVRVGPVVLNLGTDLPCTPYKKHTYLFKSLASTSNARSTNSWCGTRIFACAFPMLTNTERRCASSMPSLFFFLLRCNPFERDLYSVALISHHTGRICSHVTSPSCNWVATPLLHSSSSLEVSTVQSLTEPELVKDKWLWVLLKTLHIDQQVVSLDPDFCLYQYCAHSWWFPLRLNIH